MCKQFQWLLYVSKRGMLARRAAESDDGRPSETERA